MTISNSETEVLSESGSASKEEPVIAETTQLELPFPVYYNSNRRDYYVKKASGTWHSQNVSQLKRRLKDAGLPVDQVDRAILKIEDEFDIGYAGPLAGKTAGFYDENGIRILVTESPTIIDPVPGEWPVMKKVFEGLLVDNEPEEGLIQWHTIMGWLQSSVQALRSGHLQYAQALAIAGPRNSGKSLMQSLITEMLGGRSAKGARYMMGKTQFNSELFAAEHIMLEDEFMANSKKERDRLGAALKNFTVSTNVQSLHQKNREAINLPAFWRVTISLNDDPEALLVLPPLDEHIEDKIILLRGISFDMPMPTATVEDQAKFRETLTNEIPHFLHWLLEEYEIPPDFQDSRFIVKTYHHPEIRNELELLSPEAQLMTLIDEVLWDGKDECWEGRAEDLRRILTGDSRTRSEANKLLDWSNATGTMLGRLARKNPERVQSHRTDKERKWRINRPEST